MEELIEKVEQWATDRNLHTASPQGQALKVVEEFTETLMAHEDNDTDEVIDGIGDTYVTLIILCKQLDIDFWRCMKSEAKYFQDIKYAPDAMNWLVSGVAKDDKRSVEVGVESTINVLEHLIKLYELTPKQCLSAAYDEIKDRKGMMIDGTFVKYEDLSDENKAVLDNA